MQTLLIVDDEKHTREGLRKALERSYEVYLASSAQEAFALFEVEAFDVVLTDLRMGAGASGLGVVQKALSLKPAPVCIMMTAYSTVDVAVEAMKQGVYDFLPKPVQLDKLELVIKQGLRARKLEAPQPRPIEPPSVPKTSKHPQSPAQAGIIGQSEALLQALSKLSRVAPSAATVLLLGETGTGKELFAQALHDQSRRKGPFVPVHCAALPENLLASELFGHEKGAFTGAAHRRIGRFEAAHTGTLFLDEIAELDLITQVKLLRFLETRTFERLGSNTPVPVDVRLVCATHQDLKKRVQEGAFREDLFYRLDVVTLHLPPLRARTGDVLVLLEFFLKKFASENKKLAPALSPEALERIQAYSWPGNIRELRNFCESLVVAHPGPHVAESDLDPRFWQKSNPLSVGDHKRDLLTQALVQAKGNRTRAAELMGISRRTLYRILGENE